MTYLSFALRNSGQCQVTARRRRSLHVILPTFCLVIIPDTDLMIIVVLLLVTHSWEFFTTLNYEWSFISGQRKARWTIWVRTVISSKYRRMTQGSFGPAILGALVRWAM